MQAHVYPCIAVTPVNNFRLKKKKHQDDFNRVCWSRKNFRRYYISIYSLFPGQQEHAKLCIQWFNLVGVRGNKKKNPHNFSCWSGEDAGQTYRTWRKNVELCFLVYARKHSDGMSKHCIRQFAIMCNITGVTIGRKFTQYIDLSFFLSKRVFMLEIAHGIPIIHEIYKRHCKLFHIILERRELTVCCNQQWNRTEIRNARNVLSLFFIYYLKWYFILIN